MEVARSSHGISVSQRKYVLDLLRETGMSGCKPVETPMNPNIKLEACGEGILVGRGKFQRLVGKLICLIHTLPDKSFAVSKVSQFLSNPSEGHMEAMYQILRYLKKDLLEGDLCSRKHSIAHLKSALMRIGHGPLLIGNQLQAIVLMYGVT